MITKNNLLIYDLTYNEDSFADRTRGYFVSDYFIYIVYLVLYYLYEI